LAHALAPESVLGASGIVGSELILSPWSSAFRLPSVAPGPTTARFRTSQSAPRAASSPTTEPTRPAPAPIVVRAPTTEFSTTAPAPTRPPAPRTARLPTRAPRSTTAHGPTYTGGH